MMALALHMFSAIEHGVATLGTVTVADERWAWVSLALVPGITGNARRYHDLLRLGRRPSSSRRPAALSPRSSVRRRPRSIAGFDWRQAARRQAEPAARCGARLVLLGDPEYPAGSSGRSTCRRRSSWCAGDLLREDALGMAIVGSRRGSPLRAPDGGAAGRRPGRPRGDRGERAGAGGGHRRPPGRPRRRGPDAGRPGLWSGRRVSPRERRPGARGGQGRRRGVAVPDGDAPAAAITSRRGTVSSPGSRSAPWSSRPRSGAGRSSRRAWPESSAGRSTRCPGTSRPRGVRARTA